MRDLSNVLTLASSSAWALRPEYCRTFVEILSRRAGPTEARDNGDDSWRRQREAIDAQRSAAASMSRSTRGAVAVVPVLGLLLPRASMYEQASGATSPEAISAALAAAIADENVSTVVLDINSPGGSVHGIPELASRIRNASKPVVAQVNYMAASAAYWLASQAREIVVSPSGEVGSIGVYTLHEDLTAALDKAGVRPTFISAGDRKLDGHPFIPLSEAARANMQAQVDEVYASFTSEVARGRGVAVQTARGQAFGAGAMLLASAAVKAGMADRIATIEETVTRFAGGARAARAATQGARSADPRGDLDLRARELELLAPSAKDDGQRPPRSSRTDLN